MARKPLIGTVEENWREHGTGALNIAACRIDYASQEDKAAAAAAAAAEHRSRQEPNRVESHEWGMRQQAITAADFMKNPGRWPANLIHDGSEEVLACFPDAPGQCGAVRPDSGNGQKTTDIFGKFATNSNHDPRGDVGSAARFFYCAKASKEDREAGLEWLDERQFGFSGGANGAIGRGEQYDEAQTIGLNRVRKSRNHHPTVKPTDLMAYLCRLVTPKGGTVLDPFMGSGSTLKAAELEGFSAIGIDLDSEYCEIARKRIASDAPLFAEVV